MPAGDGGDVVDVTDTRDAAIEASTDASSLDATDATSDPDVALPDASTDTAPLDVTIPDPCDGGARFCNGQCIDVSTDLANCGACGNACPGASNECGHPTCTAGVCGREFTAVGTALAAQTAGDCRHEECDGAGAIVSRVDTADPPAPGPNLCTMPACSPSGSPQFPPRTAGTTCTRGNGSAGVCDGRSPNPSCVPCVADGQCSAPTPACETTTNVCVACTTDAHCPRTGTPRCDVSTHTCVPDTVLLVAGNLNTGGITLGASFRAGSWSTTSIAPPAADIYAYRGGGVVVTGHGRGVAMLGGSTDAGLYSLTFRNTNWSTFARQGTSVNRTIGRPMPSGTAGGGAIVAHQIGTSASPIDLSQYDDASNAWSTLPDDVGIASDMRGLPGAVADASGNPIVIAAAGSGLTYVWSRRVGGVWSAPANMLNAPLAFFGVNSMSEAVLRPGTSQLVAVMRAGSSNSELRYAVWNGTTWSAATTVATDASGFRAFSMAPLLDGRVALAYVDNADHVRVGFFDGSAWSAFDSLTLTPNLFPVNAPMAIARGANGDAVLELAYASDMGVWHTRLTRESPATWTTPVLVGGSTAQFGGVWLAVGP